MGGDSTVQHQGFSEGAGDGVRFDGVRLESQSEESESEGLR